MTTPGQGSDTRQRQITFNDGNSHPVLGPHDLEALRAARDNEPVVLSDDVTLGRTISLGFAQVPVVALGVAGGLVAVVSILALATGAVHGGFSRFLLVVMALVAAAPAVRFLPARLLRRESAIAIGHAGVTIHRRGKELHIAWVEVKGIRVAMTTHHPAIHRPKAVSGQRKLQARSQILLAPAVPGGFDTHQSSGLLRMASRSGKDTLVSALITYSHAIPVRHRLFIDDDRLPESVLLVDAALRRFAGYRYARPKVTRRQRPFLW